MEALSGEQGGDLSPRAGEGVRWGERTVAMSEEDRLMSELREREEQYRSIFESTSDALLILSLIHI